MATAVSRTRLRTGRNPPKVNFPVVVDFCMGETFNTQASQFPPALLKWSLNYNFWYQEGPLWVVDSTGRCNTLYDGHL